MTGAATQPRLALIAPIIKLGLQITDYRSSPAKNMISP